MGRSSYRGSEEGQNTRPICVESRGNTAELEREEVEPELLREIVPSSAAFLSTRAPTIQGSSKSSKSSIHDLHSLPPFLADDPPGLNFASMKTTVARKGKGGRGGQEEGERKAKSGGCRQGGRRSGDAVDPPRRGPLNLQSIFPCTDPISRLVRAI